MSIQSFTIDHNLRAKVWQVVRILVCLIAAGIIAVIFANREEYRKFA